MKHKLYHRLTALVCAFVLTLTLAPAARAAGTPAESNNWLEYKFTDFSYCINSYLYANPSGGLTRVEYISASNTIVAEDYSSSFQFQSSRTIPIELESFVGFFAGSQYNYLFFANKNRDNNDSVEVFRAVKYDKSWNRLGQASVYGANTSSWGGGQVNCAEAGGMLYIHAAHTMYGKHQANFVITVRTSDMTVTDQNCTVGGYGHYVSHSLNQFILADQEGNLILTNHGDGYPLSLVMQKLPGKAGAEALGDAYVTRAEVPLAKKGTGTGGGTLTSLGGVAETSTGYVMAYTQHQDMFIANPNQVHLAYISKADFASGASLQDKALTTYGNSSPDASTPMLVPTGLNGGWILWNRVEFETPASKWNNKGFAYAAYNADGSVGEIKTLPDVALSDCQPIVYNSKVVWYTTHNSAPVFYTLDANGVTATPANGTAQTLTAPNTAPSTPAAAGAAFSDVPTTHWAYKEIQACVANGAVTGYADGSFHPDDPVTSTQFFLMLGRACYPERLEEFQAKWQGVKPDYYYIHKAGGIFTHYLESDYANSDDPDYLNVKDKPMTRFNMATIVANLVEDKTAYIDYKDYSPMRATISDYNDSWPYSAQIGVPICLYTGVMTGLPDGAFHGDQTVTRAQTCAVINRVLEYIAPYVG